MGVRIDTANQSRITGIIDLINGVGLSLSRDSLSNYFFDVPRSESNSAIRGGFVVLDDDDVVGYCGLSPCRIHLGTRPIDGYQMGILGLKTGYGAQMFDLMDAVLESVKGSFVIANTANDKSVKLWTTYGGFVSGPEACSFIRYAVLPLSLLSLPRVALDANSVHDFTDPRMAEFCRIITQNNRGVIMARTPARLQRIFGLGLAQRKTVLLSIENADGLFAYAVLRAKKFSHTIYKRFEIIDLVALDNSSSYLRLMLHKCIRYARGHGGIMVEYIGGQSGIGEILDEFLPGRRPALANTSFWFSEVPEVVEAFQHNAGWMFGPYDGDRCM